MSKYKYICRHCGKQYDTMEEKERCFDLDMKELINQKRNLTKKKE